MVQCWIAIRSILNKPTRNGIQYDRLQSDELIAVDKVFLGVKITNLRSEDAGKTTKQ